MHVLLHEWCMSGGLAGGDAAIAREGRMMLEALAADAAKDSALETTVLVEAGRVIDLPSRIRQVEVPADVASAALVAAARNADWTVIVAPETDGILAGLVQSVRAAGGRALAPAARVIEVATDKQATVDALAARGIPVPAGRTLAAGEPVPRGFRMPAVRKARAGCGGEGLEVLASLDVPSANGPARIEAFVPGTPVGVSCVCGPRTTITLPPLRQVFSSGTTPRYLGSDPLGDEGLASRATGLARRAAAVLDADAGWLGIDMILGDRPDGRADRVLEVNPRVTTSFVGLARLYASSLVAAMIQVATNAEAVTVPRPTAAVSAGSFRLPDA